MLKQDCSNKVMKKEFTRRQMIATGISGILLGCSTSREELVIRDASILVPCKPTVGDIEGPFYIPNAPSRNDLNIHNEKGTPLVIMGRVFQGDCKIPFQNVSIEFWHANPKGEYDNSSKEQRYRCTLRPDSEGNYMLRTLLPGAYLNGNRYRPRHIHVKIRDAQGTELLTTQLYVKGDPYIEGDGFGHPSLVMDFIGSEGTEMAAEMNFVIV